jgi:hypothetical protein
MSKDVALLVSPHISGERSAAFLLEDIPLELWEHAHLFRCSECLAAMVQVASQELSANVA